MQNQKSLKRRYWLACKRFVTLCVLGEIWMKSHKFEFKTLFYVGKSAVWIFSQLKSFQTTENLLPTPPKPDLRPKTPPPVRPAPPKVLVDNKTVTFKDEPTVECLQAEIKELRMTLELLEKRQEWVQLTCFVAMFETWDMTGLKLLYKIKTIL